MLRRGAWQERAKRSWRCVVAVTALLVCPGPKLVPSACGQETAEEYRVKAVYLRRISDFVQWPASEGAKAKDASEVVRPCVVGSYAFGALLAQEAGRATLSGKKMEVRSTNKWLDFKGYQIIFVSRSENKNYAKLLEAAKGKKALTVGETGGLLEAGGKSARGGRVEAREDFGESADRDDERGACAVQWICGR